MKYYGIDTLFPDKWAEYSGFETNNDLKHDENDLLSTIRAGLGGIDKSDPLQIKDNIMNRRKGDPKVMDWREIVITEKTFNPIQFLLQVHKQTVFRDLETGTKKLEKAMNSRKESERGVVKKHFAKFVSAKSTVDCK
jgi:hypothetical protein